MGERLCWRPLSKAHMGSTDFPSRKSASFYTGGWQDATRSPRTFEENACRDPVP